MSKRRIAFTIGSALLAALGVTASAEAATGLPHSNPYQGVAKDGPTVKPYGIQGQQAYFTLSDRQWDYSRTIVAKAEQMHMPVYAAVIAEATAMQESHLVNYTDAVDHDSLGLFQQRPSCGWGTPAQVEDPDYAAGAFLSALSRIDYQHMTLTQAAQAVQGSAFPDAYAKWQNLASTVVVHISRGTH